MNAPADRTLAEYLAELARRLELVDLRAVSGLAGRARDALLPLAEVYVQPRLTGLDEPAARKEPRKDLRTLITEVRCVVVTSEPGSGKSTLLRAVSLALARPEVGLFTRRGTEAGPKPPDGLVPVFRAGLHGGRVISAQVGHIKRTVDLSGDVMNSVSRMLGLAKTMKVNILVSAELIERMPDAAVRFEIGPQHTVPVKGKRREVRVHELARKALHA